MKVPLFDLKDQHRAIGASLHAAFERVLISGQFINGPEVEELEREVAAYLGVQHAVGVSSGTDAILLALMVLGIEPGDEVLVPSFTFFATAGCVARLGAVPIFVDVCPFSFNMDVQDAARKITPKTRAVIPVHLFGQSADMEEVLKFAKEHHLFVVEDCAQAIGAKFRGRFAGSFGQFGAFSFFPTKNLGALGDAGLLTTNDGRFAEKARILRMHGMQPKYYHSCIGGNFRLDALQAALLRAKFSHLDDYAAARRAHAEYYTEKLARISGTIVAPEERNVEAENRIASKTPQVILPREYSGNLHVWNQYTIRVPSYLESGQRDALRAKLTEAGIGTEIYYPVPLHHQECFQHLPQISSAKNDLCPVSTHLASEVFSLPIYPELTELHQKAVVAAFADALA